MSSYVNYYYANNRLTRIVDKILKCNYAWILPKDYDDYYSIAGETLWYCEKHYDASRNNSFNNYLIDSLHRKFKSQITYCNRKKRGGGVDEVSLEQALDYNEGATIGDFLVGDNGDFEFENDFSVLMERYLSSLTSMQRKVADLFMQGYNKQDVKEILGLSNERFKIILTNMCDERKLAPLKKLKETRGV